jgi:hypothetical protein
MLNFKNIIKSDFKILVIIEHDYTCLVLAVVIDMDLIGLWNVGRK